MLRVSFIADPDNVCQEETPIVDHYRI